VPREGAVFVAIAVYKRLDQKEPFCAADNFKRFSVHLFKSVCQRLLAAAICSAVWPALSSELSLTSFSLLNLHLIQVIFDVLAQVAFVGFLVSQSPLCSSNFSSRDVQQSHQYCDDHPDCSKHSIVFWHRVFFAFDGHLGHPLSLSNFGPHNKPSKTTFEADPADCRSISVNLDYLPPVHPAHA